MLSLDPAPKCAVFIAPHWNGPVAMPTVQLYRHPSLKSQLLARRCKTFVDINKYHRIDGFERR